MSRAEVMIVGKMLQSHTQGYGKGETPLASSSSLVLSDMSREAGSIVEAVFQLNLRHVSFIACTLPYIALPKI